LATKHVSENKCVYELYLKDLFTRVVPYQIALHDGRLIFAPQDTDQVIRLRPPPAPDAPSSPEYVPQEGDDMEYEEGEYDDEMEYEEGEYEEDGN
jgi:hypothetical protein